MTIKRRVWAVEDEDGNVSLTRPEVNPDLTAAVMAAALAGGGSGNVNNGQHAYLVTFVTEAGETSFEEEDLGAVKATVVDKTSDGKVALSAIPTGTPFVTARKIYRTAANADTNIPSNYKLLATIANNTATTYTDNIADSSLSTAIPLRNTTENPLLTYTAESGGVAIAGADIATQAELEAQAAGASAAYPKTTSGAQTLLAAGAVDRVVHIVVTITTTFAAGDGAVPSFNFGETDTPTKFKSALNSGSSGTVLSYSGVLSAGKALLVTGTAATGTTSAGALAVTAIAVPKVA